MTSASNCQSGFTAVELLVTLFVAAAFIVSGYQLFNIVINDGSDTRAESRAANTAYDYLRRYADTATDPCVAASPVVNQSISVNQLQNVRISVNITCPQPSAPSLSKIEAVISYGSPTVTIRHATFIDKSRGTSFVPGADNEFIAHHLLRATTKEALLG